MAQKVFNIKASFNNEEESNMLLVKRESYVRKNFFFPTNMKPMDRVVITNDIGLTCLQTLRDESYTHDEYTKDEVNAIIDKFKEDAITAIAESVQNVNEAAPVSVVNEGLVFNVTSIIV